MIYDTKYINDIPHFIFVRKLVEKTQNYNESILYRKIEDQNCAIKFLFFEEKLCNLIFKAINI
jgi:hypothetical protein